MVCKNPPPSLYFWLWSVACRILVHDQILNPHPQPCKHRVLTIALPGKSPVFHSVDGLFILLIAFFLAVQKLLYFMELHLLTFFFITCTFGIMPSNYCQDQYCWASSLCFSMSFMESGLMFNSLIQFKLIFVNGVKKGPSFCCLFLSSACIYLVLPARFVKMTILLPLDILGSLAEY